MSDSAPKKTHKPQKPSRKARNSATRLAAAQVLYQVRHNSQSANDALRDFLDSRVSMEIEGDTLIEPDAQMLSSIVKGVEERINDLCEVIKAQMADKARQREVETLMQCIMLCGAYELLAHHDIESAIIINDYLDVAHAFFDKGEVGFIHGVLDSAGKVLRS